MTDQLSLLQPLSYDVEASQIAADTLFASGNFHTLLWQALERLDRGPTTAWGWWRENCESLGVELSINDYAPRFSQLKGIGCATRLTTMAPIRHGKGRAHPYAITDLGKAMLRNREAERRTRAMNGEAA